MDKLQIIKNKINKLIALDKDHKIFGSSSHNHILNTTLSEEEIKLYETKENIILPSEYKEFIIKIANGGVGPHYGLYPLGNNDGEQLELSKDFPFKKEEPFILIDVYDNIPEDLTEDEEEEFYKNIYKNANNGYILLSTEGCGMYSTLILNGAESGNIWFRDFANDAGMFPLTNPNTNMPLTFYDWYELWLDKSIEHFINGSEELGSYSDYIK
ncbi:SMI1/KNR4 family protein [Fusobacterium sp. PH5-44]|uniref:SMI1/KNR4 family protein n=1 Tax=unclassified Fusobacterium TaxID=2648384 RepID=UPI003D22D7E3